MFRNEVGAAIHVQPNSTRVLKSWGCDLTTLSAVPCESIDSYSGTDLSLIDKTAVRSTRCCIASMNQKIGAGVLTGNMALDQTRTSGSLRRDRSVADGPSR